MLQNETDNQEIFCPNCGIKNYSHSRFCYKCGIEINIPSSINTHQNDLPLMSTKDPVHLERKVIDDSNLKNQNNKKLGGCLISFLVLGIIGTVLTTIVIIVSYLNFKTSVSSYNDAGTDIVIFFSFLIGLLSIACFIFLLNKVKIGLYILIILDLISFLIICSINDFVHYIPIVLVGIILRYLVLGLLLKNDWNKFS